MCLFIADGKYNTAASEKAHFSRALPIVITIGVPGGFTGCIQLCISPIGHRKQTSASESIRFHYESHKG